MLKSLSISRILGLLTLILFFAFSGVHAQDTKDVNARSPVPHAEGGKKQKKAEKKKALQKKKLEKAIEKGRKRHEKIQTKDVKKRMKKSKRTAARNQAHKRDFFLTRWFTPKQKTKRR